MKKWLIMGLISVATSLSAGVTTMSSAEDEIWGRYMRQILPQLKKIDGWCSYEKGHEMMSLIYETHPVLCVEIGVFGGSSIFPTAAALYYLDEGIVFAIDPWSRAECLVGFEPGSVHYTWWNSINIDKIYKDFKLMIEDHDLNKVCKILRMTSTEASSLFGDESIDILHIDGNHSEENALSDVQLYLPKLKKGGYLWFDDTSEDSRTKAVELIMENCLPIRGRSTAACSLFQKL